MKNIMNFETYLESIYTKILKNTEFIDTGLQKLNDIEKIIPFDFTSILTIMRRTSEIVTIRFPIETYVKEDIEDSYNALNQARTLHSTLPQLEGRLSLLHERQNEIKKFIELSIENFNKFKKELNK